MDASAMSCTGNTITVWVKNTGAANSYTSKVTLSGTDSYGVAMTGGPCTSTATSLLAGGSSVKCTLTLTGSNGVNTVVATGPSNTVKSSVYCTGTTPQCADCIQTSACTAKGGKCADSGFSGCFGGCCCVSTCSDTDGGLNYIVKGTCTSRDNGDNYDSCDSTTTLSETYCSSFDEAKAMYGSTVHGPICLRKTVDCAATLGTDYMCLNGACVRSNQTRLRINPLVKISPDSQAALKDPTFKKDTCLTFSASVTNRDIKSIDDAAAKSTFELKCEGGSKSFVLSGDTTTLGCKFLPTGTNKMTVQLRAGENYSVSVSICEYSRENNTQPRKLTVTATNLADTKYSASASASAYFYWPGKGTQTNPIKYGDYTVYSDLGSTGSWARIIIKDAKGNTVDTLVINQGSDKTSAASGLTITLVRVEAIDVGDPSGGIISADFTVKSAAVSTATASTPVVYGAYSIYSDAGMADSWAKVVIKDSSGKTVDSLIIQVGGTKESKVSGLSITVTKVKLNKDKTSFDVDLLVEKTASSSAVLGTERNPIKVGDYSVYAESGSKDFVTGSSVGGWAKVIVVDGNGNVIDTLVIPTTEFRTSVHGDLKITLNSIITNHLGVPTSVDLDAKKIANHITHGNYYVYSDIGKSDSWARMLVVNNENDDVGDAEEALVINKGETKTFTKSGLSVSLVSVDTGQDGIVIRAEFYINIADYAAGTATPSKPVMIYLTGYGFYDIYSSVGSDGQWATIIIKDSSGKEIDNHVVTQGGSWTSTEVHGLKISIIKVRADSNNVIIGVDLKAEMPTASITGTTAENPVIKSVRNFYSWISGVFRQ